MVWMYHSLLSHCLLRDILVVPSLGVIINKAAMNNHVQIFVCIGSPTFGENVQECNCGLHGNVCLLVFSR